MKIIGSGEIEEVTKGKVYRIRHHLGRDSKTGVSMPFLSIFMFRYYRIVFAPSSSS